MNASQIIRSGSGATAALLMLLVLAGGCGPSAPPPKPAAAPAKPLVAAIPKANTPVGQTNQISDEFVSTFDTNLPPDNLGKDPFFPDSVRRQSKVPVSNVVVPPPPVEDTLKVKAITGSKGRRIAVINNETMMEGESAKVRQPDGQRIPLTCVEIGEDYVVVRIEGETTTKTLVMGKGK